LINQPSQPWTPKPRLVFSKDHLFNRSVISDLPCDSDFCLLGGGLDKVPRGGDPFCFRSQDEGRPGQCKVEVSPPANASYYRYFLPANHSLLLPQTSPWSVPNLSPPPFVTFRTHSNSFSSPHRGPGTSFSCLYGLWDFSSVALSVAPGNPCSPRSRPFAPPIASAISFLFSFLRILYFFFVLSPPFLYHDSSVLGVVFEPETSSPSACPSGFSQPDSLLPVSELL